MITESSRELLTQSTERVVASTTAFGWSDGGFAGRRPYRNVAWLSTKPGAYIAESGFAYEQRIRLVAIHHLIDIGISANVRFARAAVPSGEQSSHVNAEAIALLTGSA